MLSQRWDLKKPNSVEKSFLRFEGEARIVGGVLELARLKVRRRRAGFPYHRASPRLDYFNGGWTVSQIITWRSRVSSFA